ncbi:MAG: hypothetical protein QOF47_1824 [Mycobacterium sp.]|nr:hypothetical protein [Mycobacterium sp.]
MQLMLPEGDRKLLGPSGCAMTVGAGAGAGATVTVTVGAGGAVDAAGATCGVTVTVAVGTDGAGTAVEPAVDEQPTTVSPASATRHASPGKPVARVERAPRESCRFSVMA